MLTKKYINPEIIETICKKITNKQPVNEGLPNNGFLHIDKVLPFICVYRFKKIDFHFARLLKTQASYLICDESIEIHHLIEALRLITTQHYDSFLILELWPTDASHKPIFKINCPKNSAPGTVNALKKGFEELNLTYPNVKAEVKESYLRHPDHLDPIFDIEASKKAGILSIGISIPILYKNSETNELYSLFYREFYAVFSETIRRAVFEFIRVQTGNPYDHYLMLGNTHIDEITLEADKQLALINEGMSFLLRTTPVNSNEEWVKFKQNNFKITPSFTYRLITLDPEQEKRKLYNIPIEQVDDPTIAFILRGKRMEIEKQLTMLEERGTINFRYVGESLYGVITKDVLSKARKILKTFPKREKFTNSSCFNCYEFASQAQKELDYYSSKFPDLELSLEIRNDVAGIMVSKTKLLISEQLSIDASRCDALIHHEVGTHILTYCNGKQQPLRQMFEGFEGYDQLQEGLAVIAEYLVGGLTVNRLRLLAGRVIAVNSMVNGSSFLETFNLLRKEHSFSERKAYYSTMRVYRGGGLSKDAVYLAGVIDLMAYLKKGGSLDTLYTGKFNVNHIGLVQELLYRSVLKHPELPRFLERNSVQKRLKKLRNGIDITELIN